VSAKATARSLALKALVSYRKSGGMNNTPVFRLDDPRDSALANAIYLGVLQNMAKLDFYISCFSNTPAAKMEPLLLDILRVGAYQICLMDRIPTRAAVFEAVEQAKSMVSKGAGGLVNAVLRRLGERKGDLPKPPRKREEEYLSVQYSHPVWLCREYIRSLDKGEVEAALNANNTQPPLNIQVNTLKTDKESLLNELLDAGFDAKPHQWQKNTLIISGGADPMTIPAFVEGRAGVQDAAARASVQVAGVKAGMKVIDLCAAPGGKSFAAAMDMNNEGEILSFDIQAKKIAKISGGAARLGIDIIKADVHDGRVFIPGLEASADVVIADVPCSGMGTIRKKPDIRYKAQSEIKGLPPIQRDILENASRYVKKGGVLIYSTCTVLNEENGAISSAFLESHDDFVPEDFVLSPRIRSVGGELTLWPHRHDCDGFYICKMRRK